MHNFNFDTAGINFNGFEKIAAIFGVSIIAIVLLICLFLIPLLIIYVISLVKLFKKAGKPGWAAIIPFYNLYVLIEISELNWWYFLIIIFGIMIDDIAFLIGAAANVFIFYNLAKKFKKDPVKYAILGALFSPIMIIILGLSNATYNKNIKVSPNGPIENK